MTGKFPIKQREVQNHRLDSTIWNEFKFRPDDVFIGTYGKSGTTWMQQIVGQLILGPDPKLEIHRLSPWVDMIVPPKEIRLAQVEAMIHRRFLKSHLPVDALVFSPEAKYIYIARDGRDVVWSMYNHHINIADEWHSVMNNAPGLVGPPLPPAPDDVHEYYLTFINNNGYPWWPFFEHIRSWWAIKDLSNVKLVHFNNLKADLAKEMRGIANFLGIEIKDESKFQEMVKYCSFDWMKEHSNLMAPAGGNTFKGGGTTFINKGTNGRWQSVLSDEEKANYEALAVKELGEECAHWLATGEHL
jgi:aryl sulfotransferase